MKNQTLGQQVLLNDIQQLSFAVNEYDNEIKRKQDFVNRWKLADTAHASKEIGLLKLRRAMVNKKLKQAREQYIEMIHAQTVDAYSSRRSKTIWMTFVGITCIAFWYFILCLLFKL